MKKQELRIHQQGDQETIKNRYLVFWADNQLFGLSITYVVQIVGLQRITRLPDSPDYVKGMVSLRGDVFPVVDLRQRLGGCGEEYNSSTCIIITKISNSLYGFIIDGVDEVYEMPPEHVLPVPHLNNESLSSCLFGAAKIRTGSNEEKIVLLLNFQRILSKEEFEELALAER